MNFLYVFIGGGLGSALRYAFSLVVPHLFALRFPLATFLSNVLACLVLVLVASWAKGKSEDGMVLFLVTGFCGGLSTFSPFSYENIQLFQQGFVALALTNIALSLLAGIGVVWLLWK